MGRFSNIGALWQHEDSPINACTGVILSRAGVQVMPCHEGGPSAKAPYTPRGFRSASANPVDLDRWAMMFPRAVWGLPCETNHVLGLDADRHGNGDGVTAILALFERHGFDWRTVPTVATPNDGYHFYFNRPEGLKQTRATLCQAVDVRDNGYLIAPGCRMADGRQYRLVEGSLEQFARAIGTRCLPDPPDWMMPMLVHPLVPKRIDPPTPATIDEEALKNQIEGILRAVLRAEEGSRNMLLFWAACRLAEMVTADLIAMDVAEILLDEAGTRIGLSRREIRATAISGLRTALGGDRNAR